MRKNTTSKAAAAARDNRNTLDAAGIAATVPAASSGSPANPQGSRPSLLDAIAAYRAGFVIFNAIKQDDWDLHGGEEAVIAKTWGQPCWVLDTWDQPATSEEEAIAALHLVRDEEEGSMSTEVANSMLRAALAYFDGRPKKVQGTDLFSKKEISPIYDAVRDTDAALGISISLLHAINDSLVGTEMLNYSTGERLIDEVTNLDAVIRMIRLRLEMAMTALSDIEFKFTIREVNARLGENSGEGA